MATERAAPYGNYKGYYKKRGNRTSDPRLKVLPPSIFKDKRVLDVGCNEGWVTCEIGTRLNIVRNPQEVIGVDIDSELVGRAWRHRREVWSLQSPKASLDKVPFSKSRDEYRENSKIEDATGQEERDAYFPECFPSLFGPVPIPSPSNDWANMGCPADELGYDIVVARNPGLGIIMQCERQTYTDQKNLKLDPTQFSAVLAGLGFSVPKRAGIVGEGAYAAKHATVYKFDPKLEHAFVRTFYKLNVRTQTPRPLVVNESSPGSNRRAKDLKSDPVSSATRTGSMRAAPHIEYQ
ncbi:methyltransferase domain-containing protein [Rhizoctonia solani AG-1 IA]|uniref:RNA methyltransferase n=1 Tax=Thanatephorus cucumeris (strain AG1-IA) TaxID=983506 RepID=L8X5L7_THACA|nr:methyltransferase domain-containing protein [Rhizoctonia solani AG-1 IA]